MALLEAISATGWTSIGLAFTLLVLVNLFPFSLKAQKKEEVTLAPGGLPILGHVISFMRDPMTLCFDMKKRYGSLYALNMAGTRFNVVTDVVHGRCTSYK